MSRSWNYIRWGLVGIVFVSSLSLGANSADGQTYRTCPKTGYDYAYSPCAIGCDGGGYCTSRGYCSCGDIP